MTVWGKNLNMYVDGSSVIIDLDNEKTANEVMEHIVELIEADMEEEGWQEALGK